MFSRLKSIHNKMVVVALETTALALLLAGVALAWFDQRSFRETWVEDLSAQADVLGLAAAPALEFEDPKSAQDYLELLEAKPTIIGAAIYTAKGARFAAYSGPGHGPIAFPEIPELDGYRINGNELVLFKRIVAGREILGTVYIKASYDMAGRLRDYVGILAAVMVISLLLAVLISRRLQKSVTNPVLEVTRVAKDFIEKRDYTARAARSTDDEIGVLVDAFNGMLSDIAHQMAERKRAESALMTSEERLLALNAELESRVESRTAQLESANKDLEGFSYSVSHDLRAPIRAIGGFSALLAEEHGQALDQEGHRKLAIIRREAERMGRLIDDLLAFSRLGRKALDPAELDMTNMVNGIVERLNHADGNGKAEIRVGSMPQARGDRNLFEQVWINLIANAIKFSSKRERPLVEIGGISEERERIYYVRDNGAGFDPRYLSRLFGVFQRLHRDEEFPGTGVGLALVHKIVTRHGGRVWADGKPDGGATFHFSLPKEAVDG